MNFPEKLLQQRKAAGMTQSDLAEKLNVSRQAISRWEMGTAMPEIENLIAMSDLFGVSLDYLLKNENEKTESKQDGSQKSTDLRERIKRMKPLEIAIMAVLCLLAILLISILLERSRFGLLLAPLLIIGALYAAVIMAVHLK